MRRALTAVAVGTVVALALLAVPASADHGYQTFKFTNKEKKKVYIIFVYFDRKLSHIGDEKHTWPGAGCRLIDENTGVRCGSKKPLDPSDSFKLSVATPPKDDGSYDRARIKNWVWLDNHTDPVGKTHGACARKSGCIDLGVQGQ